MRSRQVTSEICRQFGNLYQQAFPDMPEPNEPVLGAIIDGEDLIIAPNMRLLLTEPSTILSTLHLSGKLIAASVAIPMSVMDPRRKTETDTAYIYATMVDEGHRGKGLVGVVRSDIDQQLIENGYVYSEAEIMTEGGYADSAVRHYGAAITRQEIGDPYGYGEQLAVTIDLSKIPQLTS